jgi:GNAT superfamily N-acetyltransferase
MLERIRDAGPGERQALEALQLRSSLVWEEYRADLLANPDAIEIPPEQMARVRVAEDGDEVLGFSLVLEPDRGACELEGLFVEPSVMRGGVGRALVDDAAKRARAEGADRIEVTANPRALAFYERLGFLPSGTVETRFGPGLRMQLPL